MHSSVCLLERAARLWAGRPAVEDEMESLTYSEYRARSRRIAAGLLASGSTGTPKGVTIPHRGIIDYTRWVAETFAFDETTVMANQAPFTSTTPPLTSTAASGAAAN